MNGPSSNLKSLILSRLDDNSLLNISQTYPSMQNIIDREWIRRLNTDTFSTLQFLFENQVPKSLLLQNSLKNLQNKWQWKIAVIYDYTNGNVAAVKVKIGNGKKYPLLFSWLDVVNHKKLIREVTSEKSNFAFAEIAENDISDRVRTLLLEKNVVTVEITKLTALVRAFRSFPLDASLDGGEDYLLYPSQINNISLPEPPEKDNITSEKYLYSIAVEYGPDVQLYLKTLAY